MDCESHSRRHILLLFMANLIYTRRTLEICLALHTAAVGLGLSRTELYRLLCDLLLCRPSQRTDSDSPSYALSDAL
jgi:hypothetical protein